jgi:lipid II:glycine glycyltransferase (peptidoglycan interpeptide bridge formation enzyme)
MEPQQSSLYGDYISRLGWDVLRIDGVQIFIRRFPLIGGIMKIHRPARLPDTKKLIPIIKNNTIRTLVIEPVFSQNQKQLNSWCNVMSLHVKINTSPYLPTKTIRVDLGEDEQTIFNNFTEAKRRAVRRAIRLGVEIKQSENIHNLIGIKNKSAGLFGFITTTGIDKMWNIFGAKHMSILLAYTNKSKIIGGVLLLYWDNVAYYWIAGATREGKKLYAPTLLAWEAMKSGKAHGCRQFDFVGVWDERIPKQNTEWHGFTKFKEGFGGTTLYYPLVQNKN